MSSTGPVSVPRAEPAFGEHHVFKPRGWVLVVVVSQVLLLSAVWTIDMQTGGPSLIAVGFTLLWLVGFCVSVLRLSLTIHVDEEDVRWRTALGSHQSRRNLVMSVERGKGMDGSIRRVVRLADGQAIHLTEGAECDRLLRTLGLMLDPE